MRPLLKWAGGKRQLLPALEQYYPSTFHRYLEPFVGSGAVFFHLASTGLFDGKAVTLSDVNADLIGCYRAVRDEAEAVIHALQLLEHEHRQRGDECYYEVRDDRFNPARARLMGESAGSGKVAAERYSPALAAMLIFLNRTGFNGLFRLNKSGAFNVPVGRYSDPRICDSAHIRAVGDVLRRPGIAIEHRSFEEALGEAGAGDFVYCDPPYAPLSRTSSFANYTAAGFAALDQHRLMEAVIRACRRGARVVMSNSSAPEIETAYQTRAARQVKIAVHRVPARRAINSRASSRGPVDELIITNVAGPRPSTSLRAPRASVEGRSEAIAALRGTRPTMVKASLAATGRVPARPAPASRTRRTSIR